MDLGKLDPTKKENWKAVSLHWGFWLLVVGLIGFLVITYGFGN